MIAKIFKERLINILYDVENIIDKYNNIELDDEIEKIKESIINVEYSKGGLTENYGIYPNEFFSRHYIKNYSPGKKIKCDKSYNYKYYFNINNELLMIEKRYSSSEVEYVLIYSIANKKIYLTYNEDGLHHITKCEYDNKNQLISYIETEVEFGITNNIVELSFVYVENEIMINRYQYIYLDFNFKNEWSISEVKTKLVDEKFNSFNK